MMTVNIKLCRAVQLAALSVALLSLFVILSPRCSAQATTAAEVTVAASHDPEPVNGRPGGNATTNGGAKVAPATATPDPEISPAVARQFAAMQAEIEELKAELKGRDASLVPRAASPLSVSAPASEAKAVEPSAAAASGDAAQARSGLPEKPKPEDPFAYADWTWLNGNPRNKDVVWDSKFFTPEIRLDAPLHHGLEPSQGQHNGRLNRDLPLQRTSSGAD